MHLPSAQADVDKSATIWVPRLTRGSCVTMEVADSWQKSEIFLVLYLASDSGRLLAWKNLYLNAVGKNFNLFAQRNLPVRADNLCNYPSSQTVRTIQPRNLHSSQPQPINSMVIESLTRIGIVLCILTYKLNDAECHAFPREKSWVATIRSFMAPTYKKKYGTFRQYYWR